MYDVCVRAQEPTVCSVVRGERRPPGGNHSVFQGMYDVPSDRRSQLFAYITLDSSNLCGCVRRQ